MAFDPYAVLEVAKTATQDQIKTAYRKLAKQHHPDLNPGSKQSEARFKDLAKAYELVGSAEDRAKFEKGEEAEASTHQWRSREGAPFYYETQAGPEARYANSFNGVDPEIFASFFGGEHSGPRKQRASRDLRGRDVQYELELDFEVAIKGGEKDLALPEGKTLRVKIPAGVDSGSKLRFAGQGQPGVGTGPPGDAYVILKVRKSTLYRRVGNDLESQLPISIAEAVLGAEIEVLTVDGPLKLTVPRGSNSGRRLRVKGKGVPSQNGQRGDQYWVLQIVLPDPIDSDLEQAVRTWTSSHPYNPRTRGKAE